MDANSSANVNQYDCVFGLKNECETEIYLIVLLNMGSGLRSFAKIELVLLYVTDDYFLTFLDTACNMWLMLSSKMLEGFQKSVSS